MTKNPIRHVSTLPAMLVDRARREQKEEHEESGFNPDSDVENQLSSDEITLAAKHSIATSYIERS